MTGWVISSAVMTSSWSDAMLRRVCTLSHHPPAPIPSVTSSAAAVRGQRSAMRQAAMRTAAGARYRSITGRGCPHPS